MRCCHKHYLTLETRNFQVVFTRVGEQPDGWQRANVTIGALNDFNITIWGIVGSGYQGDIAIDDVTLVDCEPPYYEYLTITESPVSQHLWNELQYHICKFNIIHKNNYL